MSTFHTKKTLGAKLGGMFKNLFGSPLNAIITLIIGYVLVRVLMWVVDWGIINATWTGNTKQICLENGGACWIFIREKFKFFVYGFIPMNTYWRINVLFILLAGSLYLLFSKRIFKNKTLLFLSYFVIIPVLVGVLARGGLGLARINPSLWGGFMLTAIFSILGLLFSFPIGLLLSLGRRSKLPIIKYFSVAYIEFFRGIPLIAVLFVASTVIPFFFPEGFEISKTIRVTVGFVLFQSAYLAEVIRGGLQTVDKIQYESADSLGLGYAPKMYFIILPQALRATIINIGDISIAFIKDTTLVYIIGLFDMLGVYVPTTSDPFWLGTESEALLFSGALYWILCYIVAQIVKAADKKINKDRRGVML